MQLQDRTLKINIGIDEVARREIAYGLSHLLADSYSLYLKTHCFHWNVTGPQFQILQFMFEQQYAELATAIEMIAERIRILGFPAPGTYTEFSQLTSVAETLGVPDSENMIRLIVAGQEAVARTVRALLVKARQVNDEGTANLLAQRLQVHEKTAWMMRSLLE
ncbi:Dps family protein [Leptolyngbya sp. FACHB-261]|uniref:Dps family protein n=1 Tax=Leptolyngbya sp. FACHB-261 TaxID=2692806 RepID=UPI0016829505|nr:Dps family protein [Leptolyngbya sp. FACHB-261]MBD2101878.1 DNA starvation/stationary phase protection protein [Leptolyngbya sp. FACHB-261]